MDKRAKWIDRAQNAAILFLCASFALLLSQTQLFAGRGNGSLPSAVRSWFSVEETPTAEDTSTLTALSVPVRIVLTNELLRSGLDALTTTDDRFEAVGSLLGEAVGSAYGISAVSEADFLAALDGSGVYFAFSSALPLEVLAARLGVAAPTAQQLDVHRCLLSLGSGENALFYLQDPQNGCFRFSTAVRSDLLADYLESQEGWPSVEFAFALGEDYAELSPYTLVFGASPTRYELAAANALGDYSTEELLRRAEFNPHANRYVESSGTTVAVEGERKLYLHPDGRLTYSGGKADEGSLFSVPTFDAERPSRAEYCAAARSLLSSLVQGRTGDAALYLSGMDYDEDGCTAYFDYMVNGTPLRFADGSHAAEIRLEERSITAFTLRLRRYTLTERSTALLPAALARTIARRYPGGEMTIVYIDPYGDTVSASWIAN